MSYRYEQDTGDLVIEGFETGISPSPLKGIANMQGVNISTETGEVMVSYSRVQQSQVPIAANAGTLIASGGAGSYWLNGTTNLQSGTWITITASTITSLPAGTYYVNLRASSGIQLSNYYDPSTSNGISHGTSGTATFNTFADMGSPVAYAIEKFNNSSGTQYRYYVLDANARVWVYDTAVTASSIFNVGAAYATTWFLPDTSSTWFSSDTKPSGIAVLNGWVHTFSGNKIWVKSTSNLGGTTSNTTLWAQMTNALMMSQATTTNPHFAYVGHQGKLYYTDGNYLGSIFPDTSLISGVANIQSYASYSASTITGTIGTLIGGSIPSTGVNIGGTGFSGIPAVFFTDQAGTQPSNLSVNTIYYIAYSTSNGNFTVYDTLAHSIAGGGTGQIDIAAGATGNQYFNTYFPIGTHAAAYGDTSTVTFTPQRLNLPYFEVATCMSEVGNTIIVGGIGNILYPWNQVTALPSSIISLPENNTSSLLTVNQMVYAYAGNRGNIYITDGSTASLVIKVPDYCAGIAGTPSTYVEPYFTWGGTAYIRGRVYFSILDQTSSKVGNCGGIWSFVPTQNLYIGQDTGLALRLENQNSYGTYSGVTTIIIPQQTQLASSPQYWSGWYSSVSNPTYGIDFTNTTPSTVAVIETDLVPSGTAINKKTFSQLEYKLSAPLIAGESVAFAYRINSTDAFVSCGTVNQDSTTSLSGYFSVNFQKTQWVQLKVTLTPLASSSSSFVRLSQIRIR